ncbi:hypothetical protein [Alsobacter soli]|nr:hypothetical protein [Alsobacter soli]
MRQLVERQTMIMLDLVKRVNNLTALVEAQRRVIWFAFDHLNTEPQHLVQMTIRQVIDSGFDYGMDAVVAARFREELEYLANLGLRNPKLLLEFGGHYGKREEPNPNRARELAQADRA